MAIPKKIKIPNPVNNIICPPEYVCNKEVKENGDSSVPGRRS